MGISVSECDAIINACEQAGVKLGIGYRLHSEPCTQQVKDYVKKKTFGDILFVSADAAYRSVGNPNQWRLNKELSGGGALMNMGVYAVQSTIYGTGENQFRWLRRNLVPDLSILKIPMKLLRPNLNFRVEQLGIFPPHTILMRMRCMFRELRDGLDYSPPTIMVR